MSFSCTNQQGCPVILDSKCVIYEGENLLYIGVNTNDNYRTALENINTVIGNLILTGGITELTGDVVAVGPGVTVATLATVNSTPGQYGSSTAIPKLTVDGKGRVTAITTEAVFIPSGALSFIGDVTGTGNTGSNTTLTLATVNNNVFINNSFLKFAVNAKGLITSASPVNFSDIDAALGYTPYSTTNPANYISRLGLSASSPLAYNNVTGNFTIQQATSTTDGYLSSVNWNTFNSKQPAGNYITDLTGEATATGPGSANVTLDNGAVTAKVLTGVNITGGNVVDTDTILTAFGKLQNQINSLIGSSIYKGTWNAATNTPTLTSGVGTRGWYYIVNTYGTTNLDGVAEWHVGDWAIFDGTAWQKVDTTDAVVSVNGQVGAVSLTTDNIPEGATNRYFTNTRARQAFSAGTGLSYDDNTGIFSSTITQYTDALARQAISLTTTGTSGAATYNNTTGVLNIPNYSTDLSGYVPYTGATADVNLGIRGLSSTNSIQGAAIFAAATGATGGEIYLSQGSIFGTFSGYGAIGATSTGAFVFLSDVSSGTAVKDARLNFGSLTNNTTRTYTFPDASGTLALTSNLSAYLPLTGGTLTGALSGTSALFTDNLRTDTGLGLKYGSFVSTSGYLNLFSALVGSTMTLNVKDGTGGFESALTFTNTANRNYTFPNADGTIALTSDIPSLAGYVPTSRTITINGTTQDLSADRSWTISATGGVSSFNTRTGAVTLSSADVTGALGFTPYDATNPAGYITSSGSISGSAATLALTSATITSSSWAGGGGYHGYSYGGGNWRFGFSSTAGVVDVYADGNFYATDSSHLVLHAGNYNSYAPTLTGGNASGTWSINITGSAGSASTATNASQLNGISSTQIFNNMGNNHSTYTDFNSVGGFGVRYLQGSTNGPGTGATQYYGFTLGLGNEYPYSGGGSYGTQFYWNRTPTGGNPYVSVRFNEAGTWGSWSKIYAGYADSAGSASSATSAGTATTLTTNATITGLNFGGVLALTASGASTGNTTGARLTESYGPVWNLSNGATWHHQVINGSYLSGFNASGGNFGNGNYYGTGDVVAYYSDMRLKTKVSNITNALEKVKSLEGFTYVENELARSLGYTNTKEQSGISAQQVQAVLPEAVSLAPFDMQGVPETGEIVSKSGENYLTVKYDRLVPLLIEAIKEQQLQIEELKSTINDLTK